MESIPVQHTTQAFEILLDKGVLGAVLVLAIAAVVTLLFLYVKAMEHRVAEAAKWQQIIEANTQALRSFTEVERQRMLFREHELRMRAGEKAPPDEVEA
jgi:hypothetical protein